MSNDYLKPYIVQIQGSMGGKGSGVLVKDENGIFYIFTAKHNFKSTKYQEVEDIEIEDIKEDIELGKVKITSYHEIEVSDVIGLEDLTIDFVVLVVNKKSFKYLDTELKLKSLKIYNDGFKECIVSGYPKISTSAVYIDCKYETKSQQYEKKDDYKNTFKVSSLYPLHRSGITEVDTVSGISGGGVFVKGKYGKIYLVGIEIEYIDIHNLVCIDLQDIVKELDINIPKKENRETIDGALNDIAVTKLALTFLENNKKEMVEKTIVTILASEEFFTIKLNQNDNLKKFKESILNNGHMEFIKKEFILPNKNNFEEYNKNANSLKIFNDAYYAFYTKIHIYINNSKEHKYVKEKFRDTFTAFANMYKSQLT